MENVVQEAPSKVLEAPKELKTVHEMLQTVSGIINPLEEIQTHLSVVLDEVNSVHQIVQAHETKLNQMVMQHMKYYRPDLARVPEAAEIVSKTIRYLKDIYLREED